MGTRHLIIIYYKGEYVIIQYGQWDGYPSGQGRDIVNFILVPGNVERLKSGLKFVRLPSDSEKKDIETRTSNYEEKGWMQDYPLYTRDTSAKMLEIIANATKSSPVLKKNEDLDQ